MKLVLASNNAKKLLELSSLLAPLAIELVTQGSLGIPEAEEPHFTFVENALAKARHASQASGLPALADDSGLCVDALRGSPGVLSARYATLYGMPKDDTSNNRVLLDHMAGHTLRSAHFIGVLVALRTADDPEPLVAVGRWQGELLDEPQGTDGFGYDPLLFIPSLGRSVAELDAATKNRHSHRALAAVQMLALMREVWRV